MAHYFITGASGVVGSTLVSQLLEDPANEIFMLMRAESDEHLSERKEDLLEFCRGERTADAGRVHALRGDISQEKLGLGAADWDIVTGRCTRLLHCAADVNLSLPRERALAETMAGARGIVQCLKESRTAEKLEYVSTVGVGGRVRGGVPEDWITTQREFRNSYEEAKATAENFIRERVLDGFPITVHRPSMVVGDSKSGRNIHFQVFYHLSEFLSGRRTLGIVPSLPHASLDLVPCDYVAAVILWSSRQSSTIGKVLHECSSSAGSVNLNVLGQRANEIFDRSGLDCPKRRLMPLGAVRIALKVLPFFAPPKTRKALKTLDYFLPYLDEPQHFENSRTDELLKGTRIVRPSAESYLEPVLSHYVEKRYRSGSRSTI